MKNEGIESMDTVEYSEEMYLGDYTRLFCLMKNGKLRIITTGYGYEHDSMLKGETKE